MSLPASDAALFGPFGSRPVNSLNAHTLKGRKGEEDSREGVVRILQNG